MRKRCSRGNKAIIERVNPALWLSRIQQTLRVAGRKSIWGGGCGSEACNQCLQQLRSENWRPQQQDAGTTGPQVPQTFNINAREEIGRPHAHVEWQQCSFIHEINKLFPDLALRRSIDALFFLCSTTSTSPLLRCYINITIYRSRINYGHMVGPFCFTWIAGLIAATHEPSSIIRTFSGKC